MMIHAAVDYQELLSPGHFYVANLSHIYPCFTDQKPARLDHKLRACKAGLGCNLIKDCCQADAELAQIKFLLVGKVRNAKPAAEVQPGNRAARLACHPTSYFQSMSVLIREKLGVKDLSAREDVDSAKIDRAFREHRVQYILELLLIDPKRSGTSAHPHGAAFGVAGGIHADGNSRAPAQALADQRDASSLRERLQVNFANPLRK